jgi:tetratricopeptide (TPR) repeat protein
MQSERLTQAIALRQAGQFEDAQVLLDELYAIDPDNALINFHYAWLCDTQGKESEAVPYYERAIANGLTGEDLRGALLGLGSTYRALGQYEKAVETLRRGSVSFPDAREFPVFLAIALYNTGQYREAVETLLRQLLETTQSADILAYKNALAFYQDKLDETWT